MDKIQFSDRIEDRNYNFTSRKFKSTGRRKVQVIAISLSSLEVSKSIVEIKARII